MKPLPRRMTVLDVLSWIAVCIGGIWIVLGALAIFAPFSLSYEVVSFVVSPLSYLRDLSSGQYGVNVDFGSGHLIIDLPTGRHHSTLSGFGLGMIGVGVIMTLAPSVLIYRLRRGQTSTTNKTE